MLTWFSKPSLESGKEGKQTNKHWESFICIVTFFLRKLYHKVKLAWPGTGRTKDNILFTRLNILIFLPILAWKYSSIILDLWWHFRLECIECITEHLVIASTGFFVCWLFLFFKKREILYRQVRDIIVLYYLHLSPQKVQFSFSFIRETTSSRDNLKIRFFAAFSHTFKKPGTCQPVLIIYKLGSKLTKPEGRLSQ